MKITVTREIEFSQLDIDVIMVTALEGGINYWCRRAEVIGDYLGEYASDQISRGGSLVLHDIESDDKWELTPENFSFGLKLYFEQNPDADMDDLDADMADSIIQYALFGEIMFG